MKLTPWFPAEIKPVRKGVYERDTLGNRFVGKFSYWDGEFWRGWSNTIAAAEANGLLDYRSCLQNNPWRGLAKPPRKAKR